MRRVIETIPSIIFLIFFLAGLYLKISQQPWVNTFVIGITGVSVYSFVIIIIEGIHGGVQTIKGQDWKIKLFYAFHICLWIGSTTLAIYLMAHN